MAISIPINLVNFKNAKTACLAAITAACLSSGASFAQSATEDVSALLKDLQKADFLQQPGIVQQIEAIGEAAVPALVDAMNQGDLRLRHQSIEILGRMRQDARAATPELIKSLSDDEPQIRRNAAWALGRVGEDAGEAMPILLKTALDEEWDVRADAVWAMGKVVEDTGEFGIVDAGLVEAVISHLGDLNPHVRWSAAWSLARFGPGAEAALPALVEALSDWSYEVRASAAAALGRIAASHHEEMLSDALHQAMDDENDLVRTRARAALDSLRARTVPGF
ncbi:MAG: HEAT repeat domain-containing protein [Pseudomonadota bacterium]